MTIKAPAKINVCLDVKGKRDDGYHELDMIMCEIPLCDTVTIEKGDSITVRCDKQSIPQGEENIAYKAAAAFFRHTEIKGGADIFIEKVIPDGAGLGGGSSDGAAVIRALDIMYETELSENELREIAVTVGADVPFFIEGGSCIAQGIGEILMPINDLPPCWILLAKPDFSISTKEAFSRIDSVLLPAHVSTAAIAEAIDRADLSFVGKNMFNMLECVVQSPEIDDIKQIMKKHDAVGSLMSGSGSCVFGLFEHFADAERCKEKLKNMEFCEILRNI